MAGGDLGGKRKATLEEFVAKRTTSKKNTQLLWGGAIVNWVRKIV